MTQSPEVRAELANLGVPASPTTTVRSCRCGCADWPGKLLVSAVGVQDHPEVDTSEIQAAFDDVFDQAIA